jgi:fluoroquinolone resistance protein
MDRATPTPLSQSQLDACVADGSIADCVLGDTIAWPALAQRIRVRNSDFVSVGFRQATLTEAHFVDCRFLGCSFRSSDLSDCFFERCRFYDPQEQAACDFSYATLRNGRFEGCDLTTAVCSRTRAFGIELRRCQASGIDFGNADFSFGKADFVAATFIDCNLAYADFSRTTLAGATFAGSRLSHSIWHDADLAGADLAGCVLDNVDARGLVLRGADLRGAQFNNLDPRLIDLTGVRMLPEQGLEVLRTLGIDMD